VLPPRPPLDTELAAFTLVSGTMELVAAWIRGDYNIGGQHLADLVAAKLAEWSAVRNPSAVVPADANPRERRQPLDLLILKATNAVNGNKRPVRRVRIEKDRGSDCH
jgi:hypothetical protein